MDMELQKYVEPYTPDGGQVYTQNEELGEFELLSYINGFMVSDDADISFVTAGGDTVTNLPVLAGEKYMIQIVKITALSTGVVYMLHNGRTRDMRETAPTTQASSITFDNVTDTTLDVTFTNGSGISRIIVAREGGAVDATPSAKITYVGDENFGDGDEIGTGNFVVGVGSGPFSITGLTAETTYHFRVFEFRGAAGKEAYNVATATNNPGSQATTATP